MLSEAGRQYDRSKKIQPLSKSKRIKLFSAHSLQKAPQKSHPLFSPFNTVSRDSRQSYLLRVTLEPNPQTNYDANYQTILSKHRNPTIDQAPFTRMIGPAAPIQSLQPPLRKRCAESVSPSPKKCSTVRESHNWRKTLQHFDFDKQPYSMRQKLPMKLSVQDSTNADFMRSLKDVTESNFNNYSRFKLLPDSHNSHSFASDSAHHYLEEVQKREASPEHDLSNCDESFVRNAMRPSKAEHRFELFRSKIATRHDRADAHWHTLLEYEYESQLKKLKPRVHQQTRFEDTVDRRDNDIHSKYPIRISLA